MQWEVSGWPVPQVRGVPREKGKRMNELKLNDRASGTLSPQTSRWPGMLACLGLAVAFCGLICVPTGVAQTNEVTGATQQPAQATAADRQPAQATGPDQEQAQASDQLDMSAEQIIGILQQEPELLAG